LAAAVNLGGLRIPRGKIFWPISFKYWLPQIQKKFDADEITSILERSTRNCPWSGDLWGLIIRFLAEQDDYPLGNIAAQKDKAISIPWLSAQKIEMAKLYYAWISICRQAVVDWDDETDEGSFLESELAECLEKTGTGILASFPACLTSF
jgi:hypothetical protein